jgi:hypothetical protein
MSSYNREPAPCTDKADGRARELARHGAGHLLPSRGKRRAFRRLGRRDGGRVDGAGAAGRAGASRDTSAGRLAASALNKRTPVMVNQRQSVTRVASTRGGVQRFNPPDGPARGARWRRPKGLPTPRGRLCVHPSAGHAGCRSVAPSKLTAVP